VWPRHSEVPDLRQEVYVRVYQSATKTRPASPRAFLFATARHPVEWYEYPNEGHIKRSPANKWWVYRRNLDWFRFWLQGREDPDPGKRDQYERWRRMKADSPVVEKRRCSSVRSRVAKVADCARGSAR
jgi:hypothetical protein